MPVFPPRGNQLQMGFQSRIFEVIPFLLPYLSSPSALPHVYAQLLAFFLRIMTTMVGLLSSGKGYFF
jgi:hypothetical protein